jgi:hypothetical protein
MSDNPIDRDQEYSRDITISPPFRELHIRENLENLIIGSGILTAGLGLTYGAIKMADYYHIFGFSFK